VYIADNIFLAAVEKATLWMKDLERSLGAEDPQTAYQACRAVLHAVRDQLSPEESSHLTSPLPLLIRGIYFEGWNPASNKPPAQNATEFFQLVMAYHGEMAILDAETMTEAVLFMLAVKVSASDLRSIKSMLPPYLSYLWPCIPLGLERA